MTTKTRSQIHWMPWGPEAIERARREDKFILIDSGAAWCHWCHVMDRVTYEDPEVAAVIEELCVPVRIDRDRQSEVDAFLQRSQPLAGTGNAVGWPLTVVLTPEGGVLFKATFLPPRGDPEYGSSMGLIDILQRLDEYWRAHREQINQAADKARQQVQEGYDRLFQQPGPLNDQVIGQILAGIKDSYEPLAGGFGTSPKFFSSAALELLLSQAWSGDTQAGDIVTNTLDHIARGGVCDQIGGGFHRYSVDERWHVPHFEKMAYDNAAMLAVFANAYALTGREEFAKVARHTLGFVAEVLTDPQSGAFYASQDADVGLDDDGDYFTWTQEEFVAAAGPHADWLASYYGVDSAGDMRDRPGRNVLHVPKPVTKVAKMLDVEESRLRQALVEGQMLLLQARRQRKAPAVDTTVFADLNGMMIDAHLAAGDRLYDARTCAAALRALDSLLATHRDEACVFAHYVAQGQLQEVGLLADQAWMGKALVHAYVMTGRVAYLDAARSVADYILAHLLADDGSFVSAPAGRPQIVTPPPMRCWEDSPVRSVGSVAADFLTALGHLAENDKYTAAARLALETLAAGVTRDMGMFLAGYASAVEHAMQGPRTITVVGPMTATRFDQTCGCSQPGISEDAHPDLATQARQTYVPHAMLFLLDVRSAEDRHLIEQMGHKDTGTQTAYICQARQCFPPANDALEFMERVERLKKG